MKIIGKSFALLALVTLFGAAVAVPAHADWYDGHHFHHGHIPYGWRYDPHLHYYVYAPGYVYAPPGGIVVAQPAPPPIVVTPAPQVVYEQPAPVVYAAPQPPPPIGIGLGIHIR